MSRYADICAAYATIEPRMLAMDRTIRELPERMRVAIAKDLGVGDDIVMSFEKVPVRYVELFWHGADATGQAIWMKCDPGSELVTDALRIPHFTTGITIMHPQPNTVVEFTRIFLNLAIEEPTESSLKLRIENGTGGLIPVDLTRADCYSDAARRLVDWAIGNMRDPTGCLQL